MGQSRFGDGRRLCAADFGPVAYRLARMAFKRRVAELDDDEATMMSVDGAATIDAALREPRCARR